MYKTKDMSLAEAGDVVRFVGKNGEQVTKFDSYTVGSLYIVKSYFKTSCSTNNLATVIDDNGSNMNAWREEYFELLDTKPIANDMDNDIDNSTVMCVNINKEAYPDYPELYKVYENVKLLANYIWLEMEDELYLKSDFVQLFKEEPEFTEEEQLWIDFLSKIDEVIFSNRYSESNKINKYGIDLCKKTILAFIADNEITKIPPTVSDMINEFDSMYPEDFNEYVDFISSEINKFIVQKEEKLIDITNDENHSVYEEIDLDRLKVGDKLICVKDVAFITGEPRAGTILTVEQVRTNGDNKYIFVYVEGDSTPRALIFSRLYIFQSVKFYQPKVDETIEVKDEFPIYMSSSYGDLVVEFLTEHTLGVVKYQKENGSRFIQPGDIYTYTIKDAREIGFKQITKDELDELIFIKNSYRIMEEITNPCREIYLGTPTTDNSLFGNWNEGIDTERFDSGTKLNDEGNIMSTDLEIKINGEKLNLGTKIPKVKTDFQKKAKVIALYHRKIDGSFVRQQEFKSIKEANASLSTSENIDLKMSVYKYDDTLQVNLPVVGSKKTTKK